MLLVIFGAGASWDSVPDAVESATPDFYRPPLAKDLFDMNRRNFGEVLLRYGTATQLVMDLERRLAVPDGPTLEQELERFQEEAETTYPPRHQQLTAVRFYLQRTLWECSVEWQREKYGKNNYVGLLGRLDMWGHLENQRIALVTFNYDTLLDSAFTKVFRRPLDKLSNYMDEKVALFQAARLCKLGAPRHRASQLQSEASRRSIRRRKGRSRSAHDYQ